MKAIKYTCAVLLLSVAYLSAEVQHIEEADRSVKNGCSKGWYAFGNSCYKFVVKSVAVRGLSWNDARQECISYKGDLLSVADKLEMDFIDEISSRFVYHRQHLWIGLNDQRNENKFVWSDGTSFNPSAYKNWGQGEPSIHSGDRCAVLFNKAWDDVVCTKEYGFICEKPKEIPVTGANKPVICSTGWTTYGKSCYKFSSDTKNWHDAKADCKKAGGYLVKIDDDDEQHFITVEQIKTAYSSWIGLHDISNEGSYTWVYDDTVPTHAHWGMGEPNNHNYKEDCVAIWGGALAGYWNDDSCNAWNKYICEKDVADWNAHGCYTVGKKKVLNKIFGRYRITGLVDKCKAAAERLGYHVFGVGVQGKKIKYTVCVTTTNGKPRKNGKYGKFDKKFRGCNIDPFGLGAGNKPNIYFVYTRVKGRNSKAN
ncbi:macrophage mannose receptor 1-like [Oculina patagonica]